MKAQLWKVPLLVMIGLTGAASAGDEHLPPILNRAELSEKVEWLRRIQERSFLPTLESQEERLAALQSRIEGLEDRVQRMEKEASRSRAATETGTALLRQKSTRQQRQLDELAARIATLEQAPRPKYDPPPAAAEPPAAAPVVHSWMYRRRTGPVMPVTTSLRTSSVGPAGYRVR